MKRTIWKKAAAIGMTFGMLISSIPFSVYADEMIVEDDSYIVAEDDTEAVMEPETEEFFENNESIIAEEELPETEYLEEDAFVTAASDEDDTEDIDDDSGSWTDSSGMFGYVQNGDDSTFWDWSISDSGTLSFQARNAVYPLIFNPWTSNLPWLKQSDKIQSVILPTASEVQLPDYFLTDCKNLKTVIVPGQCESFSVGAFAFERCYSLETFDLSKCYTTYEFAFYHCRSLTRLDLSSIEMIYDDSFEGCTSVSEIYFRENAPEVGICTFADVTATAYYPRNNPTWTQEIMDLCEYNAQFTAYHTDITWVPYDPTDELDTDPDDLYTDRDSDGIPDSWEVYGADVDGNGTKDIDFPTMGADPNVPDIFVEVDWMEGISVRPGAMRKVYEQFAVHGINLHVDAGPNSIDYVTGKTWGALSCGNSFPYAYNFSTNDSWGQMANTQFESVRRTSFRYCLFVDHYNDTRSSGLAQMPGQLLIIADVDGWISDNDTAQAGTFMHELGHTLGLNHGGDDGDNYKPNHISVMNYMYQTKGLAGTGAINYSEFALPALKEEELDEGKGIDPEGLTAGTGLTMRLQFNGRSYDLGYSIAKTAVDFDLNGVIDHRLKYDVNNDNKFTELRPSIKEWTLLQIKAGNIGQAAGYAENNEIPEIEDISTSDLPDEFTKDEAEEHHLLPEDTPIVIANPPKEKQQKTTPAPKPKEKITITKKPTIQKPAAAKGKITVKWKHFKHTSKKTKKTWKKIKKVQVQCATDSSFKNIVKTTTVKKSKTSAKIKGLKKKTTYYVRVRYYDGTGYSAWSKVKKVKTK